VATGTPLRPPPSLRAGKRCEIPRSVVANF
jgi:hypothetical protein